MSIVSLKEFSGGQPVETVNTSGINLPSKEERKQSYLERVGVAITALPGKLKEDVTAGAKDIETGLKMEPQNILGVGPIMSPTVQKGVTKTGLRVAGDVAGAIFSPISTAVGMGIEKAGEELPTVKKTLGDMIDWSADKISDIPAVQEFAMKHPEAEKDFERILNLIMATGVKGKIENIPSGIKKLPGEIKTGVETGISKIKTGVGTVIKKTGEVFPKISSTIEDFGTKIKQPNITSGTAVSLNPKKALMESGQDIQVSVGGKLKKLSEVNPREYTEMQLSTEKSLTNFEKQAELYKNNRNPLNDPTEIVGQRVDKALNFADKKRQAVGQKMGEIEGKYKNETLPIGENVTSTFAETIKSFDNPKYGVDTADASVVRKLVSDFDALEKGGATIGERLEFVRSWDRYLNDAKDAFGNFKENATVNTRIQNAVRKLKDETVNAVSSIDKVYKGLRSQYSMYKKLNEIGDSLLGKEGMLGDKIKGGATVKRALKSNSDAGARQFLTKLKEITGYDAIKDGDLAITAMENVGDFQGLSLLEILKEGKTGIIKKGLEKIQDVLVGDKKTRIKEYIKE